MESQLDKLGRRWKTKGLSEVPALPSAGTSLKPYVDLWSTLHSLQVKKIIGNETAKNYLKESLSCILCFIIQGKGSSWKRFDPEI